jgi:putative hydrolase of the HAD superfamily
MSIKHVFFDLDHTLWDFEKNSAKAYEACFKKNQLNINLNEFLKAYVPINERYWKLYREEKVTKEALKYGRLKEAFNQTDFDISDSLIDKIAEEYLDFLPTFNSLFDGAIAILDYLAPKYQLHIITNGFAEIQTAKLSNSGISHYFKELITSESVGVKKPDPKIFNYALQKAKANPAESMMIGDSLEADVLGAENVGMQAIFFKPDKSKTSKKYHNREIKHLDIIKKYL